MPAASSGFRIGLSRAAALIPVAIPLALGLLLAGCGEPKKVEGKESDASSPTQPGLFSVSPDQLSHLQIAVVQRTSWPVAVHTTGTVDFDADHTTQAITQATGPISRIVVDTGSKVAAGDPLLYVSSPDVAAAISA